jgi:hypothetical protein
MIVGGTPKQSVTRCSATSSRVTEARPASKWGARHGEDRTAYPGHGSSDESASQIAQQAAYLRTFRGLVRPATLAGSAADTDVAPDELQSIIAELDRQYPDFPLVASLPNLQELNVAAVAGELHAEDPASTPLTCR